MAAAQDEVRGVFFWNFKVFHWHSLSPPSGPGVHDFAGAVLKSWMAGPAPGQHAEWLSEVGQGPPPAATVTHVSGAVLVGDLPPAC